MPNHITNEVSFVGTEERVKELREFIKGQPWAESDDNSISEFDFNKIIPPPANMVTGTLSYDRMQELKAQGIPNWYDWNIENWGTKWNAYNISSTDEYIRFDTAWSTPDKVIEALSEKFPDVEIRVKYADEDLGYNCGTYTCLNGVTNFWNPEKGSDAAYNFAAQVKYGCTYKDLKREWVE